VEQPSSHEAARRFHRLAAGFRRWFVAEPDQEIKPYHDTVWVLKRTGLALLAFYVALAVGAVSLALGVSNRVVAVGLGAAAVLFFAVINWWFLQNSRREKRRRAAIRALRSGEPIEAPVLVAKPPVRHRLSRHALIAGLVVVSLGLPLAMIGAFTDTVALRDVGFALMVLDLVVLAIVLPGLSARHHRRSRQPASDGNLGPP
jgi:hypothetical protein